ncbi:MULTISPECIES: RNA polymerase sigma factor [unclassified Pseudoxanthomonas]|uniref:RNA polymerase sigma factor n=1 Tax=unclassified Pseudoxanthomonas TaxID=2645906 RepID=UPI0016075909|nr:MULTISPECIES: RNA polymerase sigma factor [unclassified Pseudoxanthomonas]MBB3278119.1 RNA polymerase sigma-70 factor (ECF subfamily) [Pseudoxanthomonas sp. OG2]MBV7475904.1 RNA polymerase sigma factor [Pseudoxanthomonas sp. PXM05]
MSAVEAAAAGLQQFLVLRYHELKRRLVQRLGSDEVASDALQETWVRLSTRRVADTVSDPWHYVFRMAVNASIDLHRSANRQLSAREVDDLLELADPAPGPAEAAASQAELEALVRVMRELPERRRNILLAVRVQQLTQPEVARRMGISLRLVELELQKAQAYCAARLGR